MALTILDAGVLIGLLDASDAHHEAAKVALATATRRGDALALPASAFAEMLVAPARKGEDAIGAVNEVLADLAIEVEPITRQVARQAAVLRARHGRKVRLPDALVLATAAHLKAARIITTDRGWPATGVRIEVIGAAKRVRSSR